MQRSAQGLLKLTARLDGAATSCAPGAAFTGAGVMGVACIADLAAFHSGQVVAMDVLNVLVSMPLVFELRGDALVKVALNILL